MYRRFGKMVSNSHKYHYIGTFFLLLWFHEIFLSRLCSFVDCITDCDGGINLDFGWSAFIFESIKSHGWYHWGIWRKFSIWLKYNCYVMIVYLTADPSVSKCHNCITSIINIGYHYHIFWLLRSLQRKSMFISYGLYLHDNTKFR